MLLRGEETLALSQEERGLFKSRVEIQKQAVSLSGLGKASALENATDVPTNRYIDMQSGLMQKQMRDLFYILERKAAEREAIHTIGKAPMSYARAATRAYLHAQENRREAIEQQAFLLDYADGVGYGLAPTVETYAAAEQIVDARLEAQKTALQTALKAARVMPVHMIAPPEEITPLEDTQSFTGKLGSAPLRIRYSLASTAQRRR